MKKAAYILAFLALSAAPLFAQHGTPEGPPITTVSALGHYMVKGKVVAVTDGTSATDCGVGGGSTAVLCQFDGSSWSAIGGTGGANATLSNLTDPTAINDTTLTFAGAGGLTAGGTNQDITLHPSGNNVVIAPGDPVNGAGVLLLKEGANGAVTYIKSEASTGSVRAVDIQFRSGGQIRINTNTSAGTGVWLLNSNNAPHMQIVQSGYIPTTTGCGSGAAIAAGSSDLNGSLTVGTTAGTCVVIFRGAFGTAPVAPICVDVTAKTVIGCTASTTALTLGTVTDGDVINWWLTGE